MRWIIPALCAIALVFAISILPAANAAPTDDPCLMTTMANDTEAPPAAISPLETGTFLVNPNMNALYKYFNGIPSAALWNPSMKSTYTVYPEHADMARNEEGHPVLYGNPLRL